MRGDYLLDTHTFLWLLNEPENVSQMVIDVMNDPASRRFLSVVSMWEICQKVRVQKLRLDLPPATFFKEACDDLLLQELPLRPYMVYETVELPLLHRDPFDRMLICQAQVEEMTLLTNDHLIRQYPVPTLW